MLSPGARRVLLGYRTNDDFGDKTTRLVIWHQLIRDAARADLCAELVTRAQGFDLVTALAADGRSSADLMHPEVAAKVFGATLIKGRYRLSTRVHRSVWGAAVYVGVPSNTRRRSVRSRHVMDKHEEVGSHAWCGQGRRGEGEWGGRRERIRTSHS